MATYYVGAGGSDTALGTSWATRLLTLNAAEDSHAGGTPKNAIAAGDTVYVGPGTYRELLRIDVSGSAGNPITYIGDYLGTNTDGVGGVVRITGSDDDQTATRASCIYTNSVLRSYRTFTGFLMDTTTATAYATGAGASNITIQKCVVIAGPGGNGGVSFNGATTNTTNTVQNCVFLGNRTSFSLNFGYGTSQVNNSNNLVQNCLFLGGSGHINIVRIGGTTIKNCSFINQAVAAASGPGTAGILSVTALTGGQTVTVNNCIFNNCGNALAGQAGNADITEDYNTFFGNTYDRVNVNTGANSLTYPPLFDPRPWMQLLYSPAAAQVVSPFDLASYSQLVNLAGTSPTTTDLRGVSVQGAQREWGALEYDSTLKISGKHTRVRNLMG